MPPKPNKLREFYDDDALREILKDSFEEFVRNKAWNDLRANKNVEHYAKALDLFEEYFKVLTAEFRTHEKKNKVRAETLAH